MVKIEPTIEQLEEYIKQTEFKLEISRFGNFIRAEIKDGREHIYNKKKKQLVALDNTCTDALDNLILLLD